MKLFDSHCHLNFSVFRDNYNQIIADCLTKDISVINIGSQINTSKRAVEIANQYPDKPIYACVGLHPVHLSQTEVDEEEIKEVTKEKIFDERVYQKLIDVDNKLVETRFIASQKVVAVGETGLDYWHEPKKTEALKHLNTKAQENLKEIQKQGFVQQLNFAIKNNLPVILHARGSQDNPEDAYLDILEILQNKNFYNCHPHESGDPVKSNNLPRSLDSRLCGTDKRKKDEYKGVIHCFGSSMEIAQKFLDLGFYIGFTGIITFRNKSLDELRDIVKNIPLDKLLVETDAPYLAPEPYRGQQNFPQYVELVARKVAEIKGVEYEEVVEQTGKNVEKLFSLNFSA